MESQQPLITVDGLGATLGDRTVLAEVSFQVYPGQITIILGGSGCGKTTVLKHLMGLYPIQQGAVSVLGRELGDLEENDQHELFLEMGVLYQHGALLNSMTVADNVALPLRQHTRLPDVLIDRLVATKLSLVQLVGAGQRYPSELSGGMRKRAALARAIALDPPLLFCDEPGAGLDPVSLAALDKLILDLKRQLGITVVLVTHEVASIRRLADRIVFLEGGHVLFEGSLNEAQQAGIAAVDDFFSAPESPDG